MNNKKYSKANEIIGKIRKSNPYANWVLFNIQPSCIFPFCHETKNLECHHVIPLYHTIIGFYKIYGDWKQTLQHVIMRHETGEEESVTYCKKHHNSHHIQKLINEENYEPNPTAGHNWTCAPRNLEIDFSQNKIIPEDQIGFISFQVLQLVGWYILNGHMDGKIITLDSKNLCKLTGRQHTTSWEKALRASMDKLQALDILAAYHYSKKNIIEIHISNTYLEKLDNPWFFNLDEIQSPNLLILSLNWFLSFQSKNTNYKIGLSKLCIHLGITDKRKKRVEDKIRYACKKISWASVKINDKIAKFTMGNRGATPIHSLRRTLIDSIMTGK